VWPIAQFARTILPLSGSKKFAREENMALVHHHEPDRSRDLALVELALVVCGIIAAAVPFLKFCVDGMFAVFQ
jgi:predicted MPP superfamily phosphohydrolase